MTRPVLLFGANGNLGAAIHRRLTAAGRMIHSISWADAARWLRPSEMQAQHRLIRADIDGIAAGNIDILFAGGDTDPSHSAENLLRSNSWFPQRVISATREKDSCRYLTFGTVMELFDGMADANPYVASKAELGQWVKDQTGGGEQTDLRGRIVHLQIHTLYGGAQPTPHMFLGQLIGALELGRPFAMSAGQQLREYHHVDDIAGAVDRLLSRSSWSGDVVLPLSSGCPVQLAELAGKIFQAAGRSANLRIGELPTHDAENLARVFAPAPDWLMKPSREPLAGVCAWVDALLRGGQDGISGKLG